MTITTILLFSLIGCKPDTTNLGTEENSANAVQSPVAGATEAPVGTAPVHNTSTVADSLPAGHPPVNSQVATSKQGTAEIQGVVKEQIPAGKYLYLRLKTDSGETWTAVLKEPVEIGASVRVVNPHRMSQFQSPTLQRTFDEIYFGTLGARPAETNAKGATPSSTQKPSALMTVPSGPNGMHISDLYARRVELEGQVVKIRGLVVKYNAEILGSNWLHVQDGSGTPAASDHDLVVTTTASAAVGDQIVIEGKVALNKDFGAGYSYALMLEKARLIQDPK